MKKYIIKDPEVIKTIQLYNLTKNIDLALEEVAKKYDFTDEEKRSNWYAAMDNLDIDAEGILSPEDAKELYTDWFTDYAIGSDRVNHY